MFDDMMKDTVALVKQTGTRIDSIKASVTSKGITTFDGSLPIEEGDTIERVRPGGIIERYTVLDAGYSEKFDEIPAHFTMAVRKETAIPHNPSVTHSATYYLSGEHARVNNNSQDNSVNISHTDNVNRTEFFEDMRTVLMQIPDEEERDVMIAHVKNLEETQGTPTFLDNYQAFMQLAANHMTVLLPFLPLLAQMITR